MPYSGEDDVQNGASASVGQMPPDLHDTHHLWLKAILLAVWVVFSFGICFFARDLQAWAQGWQIGYWMAAQGAVLMFIVIAVVYCVFMDWFERSAVLKPGQPRTSSTHHASSVRR
ncbi:MAG: DUF4212 domain-containing protein [Comamonas sp.]